MVPTRFHKYLSVFKKRESEHLPLCKPWDHAIETKSGFQPKNQSICIITKEQKEVDDSITANCIIVGSKQTIRLATKIVYLEVSSLESHTWQCSHCSSILLAIMPYRKISQDLKLAAMNLYEHELVSLDDILDCVGFSERTFYRVLSLWRENWRCHQIYTWTSWSPHLLVCDDLQYLLHLVRHCPRLVP